jgi:hypothetical protein
MAQAQAEIRRAAAVALEQEMKARVQEMQAKVVEAQAQVPLAMAEAFRQGKLGVMDYLPDGERPGRHHDAQVHRAARGQEVMRRSNQGQGASDKGRTSAFWVQSCVGRLGT